MYNNYNKLLFFLKQKNPEESLSLTLDAITCHNDLWQRYFNDFVLHELHLKAEGEFVEQILEAYFGHIHKLEPIQRIVSLHVSLKVYQLNLAKVTVLLRPLSKLQSTPESSSSLRNQPINVMRHSPGTKEHITEFVISTLFNALNDLISTTEERPLVSSTMDKLATWYQSYRYEHHNSCSKFISSASYSVHSL